MPRKLTTEEFIEKAKKIHNNKYDYSDVEYKGNNVKVAIKCPYHGLFLQTPHSHLHGCGCNLCGNKKSSLKQSMTTETFIKKASEVHSNRYCYEKTDLLHRNKNGKIIITCKEHGDFMQAPYLHLCGQGCPKCADVSRILVKSLNTNEFIKKAMEIHGDKYDYSKVEYVNSHTKVILICPLHGDFSILPSLHLHKKQHQGCPICGKEKSANSRKLSKMDFINKSNIIHENKYDYSGINYKNSQTKIKIICPKHGNFWQTPANHLNGHGCPKCGIETNSKHRTQTTKDFVEKARKVHGNKYDYSNTIYNGRTKTLAIICKEHGEFWQLPYKHLNGHCCPKCKSSHLETEIRTFLAENNIEFEEQKRFEWLGWQSLDFYLPKYNIGIECQGIQHFEEVELFGGKKSLKECQKRDNRKNELCQINGVFLLYYSHYKYKFPYKVYTDKNNLLKVII